MIRSLKSNLSRAEAIEQFNGRGIFGALERIRSGPFRSLASVYVPFRFYRVEICNGVSRHSSWFAIDAVSGSLDLYTFERVPEPCELIEVASRNRPEAALEDERARELIVDKLRRAVFQRGFFRVRDLQMRPESIPLELHVPYWLGFYGKGESVWLRVIDAVRCRFEGAKAREFFQNWLAS